MEFGESLRTTGQVIKKVGTDTANAALLGAVIGGTISLIVVIRRVWRGESIAPPSQRIQRG